MLTRESQEQSPAGALELKINKILCIFREKFKTLHSLCDYTFYNINIISF